VTTVVVMGLEYVGMPLAIRAARVGHRVTGYDIDQVRVKSAESGVSYIEDVSSGELKRALESGLFRVSADASVCAGFDVAVVAAPPRSATGFPT
jgi:UDP-N-acetyl-D-glucosamine dehydrogenase